MIFRVIITVSSITAIELDFDNFIDAATFATTAIEHGIIKAYRKEDEPLDDVIITFVKEDPRGMEEAHEDQ